MLNLKQILQLDPCLGHNKDYQKLLARSINE